MKKLIKLSLTLMFWASTTLERVLKFIIFPTEKPTDDSPEGLYWLSGNDPVIRLLSPGPQLKIGLNWGSSQVYKARKYSHISLPDLATKTLITAYPKIEEQAGNYPLLSLAGLIEEDAFSQLTTQAKGIIGELNRTHGCRLSLARIGHFLEHAFARLEGEDSPSAMLHFGFMSDKPNTRVHYTHAPTSRLEASYQHLCKDLMRHIGRDINFPPARLENEQGGLGTPFCPLDETVRKLAEDLIYAVKSHKPSPPFTLSNVIEFHKHYAIYTATFIAFSTGFRAIRDPSFLEEDIDELTGLAIIYDKDRSDHYNSRLVWIPKTCIDQLRHYRQHLMAIYRYFHLMCPEVFTLVKKHEGSGWPLNLFYFDEDRAGIKPLSPGILHSELEQLHNYHLPVNANRHYLKGRLLTSGCSPEIIEAYLGHWCVGQEPWNCLSGLHPLDYREELTKHLPKIITRDGWTPMEGFSP